MTIAALIFPSVLAATATFVVGEKILGIPKLMNLPSSIGMFCTIACLIAIASDRPDVECNWSVTSGYATFTLAWISTLYMLGQKTSQTHNSTTKQGTK